MRLEGAQMTACLGYNIEDAAACWKHPLHGNYPSRERIASWLLYPLPLPPSTSSTAKLVVGAVNGIPILNSEKINLKQTAFALTANCAVLPTDKQTQKRLHSKNVHIIWLTAKKYHKKTKNIGKRIGTKSEQRNQYITLAQWNRKGCTTKNIRPETARKLKRKNALIEKQILRKLDWHGSDTDLRTSARRQHITEHGKKPTLIKSGSMGIFVVRGKEIQERNLRQGNGKHSKCYGAINACAVADRNLKFFLLLTMLFRYAKEGGTQLQISSLYAELAIFANTQGQQTTGFSFPDSYALPDSNTLAGKVIGNAVPPLLYQRIVEGLAL